MQIEKIKELTMEYLLLEKIELIQNELLYIWEVKFETINKDVACLNIQENSYLRNRFKDFLNEIKAETVANVKELTKNMSKEL